MTHADQVVLGSSLFRRVVTGPVNIACFCATVLGESTVRAPNLRRGGRLYVFLRTRRVDYNLTDVYQIY